MAVASAPIYSWLVDLYRGTRHIGDFLVPGRDEADAERAAWKRAETSRRLWESWPGPPFARISIVVKVGRKRSYEERKRRRRVAARGQ